MKCDECETDVQVGGTVTKGCDGCLRAALLERQAVEATGKKLPPLALWARQRALELGLWPG